MAKTSQIIARIHDSIDRCRNEQQKSVLLCELARLRGEEDFKTALNRNTELRKASHTIRQESLRVRKMK
jgi:hypothetical protein